MDAGGGLLLTVIGSPPSSMSRPLFTAFALLVSAPLLPAQGPACFPDCDPPAAFRDLTIGQLVDAEELLARPELPKLPTQRPAIDPGNCHPDALLFSEINALAPAEPFCPVLLAPAASPETIAPPPSAQAELAAPAGQTPPAPASRGAVVNCALAAPDTVPGAVEPSSLPAERVPEPSALLLLVGAAAWILLRRKL